MSRVRVSILLLGLVVASTPCFGAVGEVKPVRKMGSPEHFELHAAWFLQRMIKADLSLDGSKAHAVDLVFADYIRRTAEHLPRPLLIAYPITDGSENNDAKAGVIKAQAGQNIKGDIQRTNDGSAVTLVENLLAVLDPSQELAFRVTLRRWAEIKPEPISIPIIEVMRASRDPMLNLSRGQNGQIQAILVAKGQAAMSFSSGSGNTSQLDPFTEKIRKQIEELLRPAQRRQFRATLDFVELEIADWREMKTGGNYLYAEALTLLAAEAKKTKSSAD